MSQQTLVKINPQPINLTPDQQTAWDLVTTTPGGAYADEIGAQIHAGRTDHRAHSIDQRCETCGERGIAVCKTRALRQLLIRRRGGRYEPRDPAYRASVSTLQLVEIPGDSFEDIFGMGGA